MSRFDKLQRIPIKYYNDFKSGYLRKKQRCLERINMFIKCKCTVKQAVNGTYYYYYDDVMDQNGMEKLVAMITGMLFQIEHDEVDVDLAYAVNYDINDFETGEYDDLFKPEDLVLIKADIQTIKDYLAAHPSILEAESKFTDDCSEEVMAWFHRLKVDDE